MFGACCAIAVLLLFRCARVFRVSCVFLHQSVHTIQQRTPHTYTHTNVNLRATNQPPPSKSSARVFKRGGRIFETIDYIYIYILSLHKQFKQTHNKKQYKNSRKSKNYLDTKKNALHIILYYYYLYTTATTTNTILTFKHTKKRLHTILGRRNFFSSSASDKTHQRPDRYRQTVLNVCVWRRCR